MRKLILMIILVCMATYATAQRIPSSKVPAVVKEAFVKQHPEITKVNWEKEKGNYEAGFKLNNVPTSMLFDNSGNLLETETAIPLGQLPDKVKEYVSTKYPGSKITETSKIVDNKGVMTYEAEVKGKDLIFDADGNFLH